MGNQEGFAKQLLFQNRCYFILESDYYEIIQILEMKCKNILLLLNQQDHDYDYDTNQYFELLQKLIFNKIRYCINADYYLNIQINQITEIKDQPISIIREVCQPFQNNNKYQEIKKYKNHEDLLESLIYPRITIELLSAIKQLEDKLNTATQELRDKNTDLLKEKEENQKKRNSRLCYLAVGSIICLCTPKFLKMAGYIEYSDKVLSAYYSIAERSISCISNGYKAFNEAGFGIAKNNF